MKTRARQIAVLITVCLLALGCASSLAAAQTSGVCSETKLPSAANEVLKEKFSEWRPKQISDLGTNDRELWLKAHEKDCPGIAIGHFESADQLAYAVLLVPKAKSTGGYRIVVLSASQSGGSYTSRLLDHRESQNYPELVISTAAPGMYSDFEGTESVKLKLDAINVQWIEKASVVYHWSAGRYRTLQVDD